MTKLNDWERRAHALDLYLSGVTKSEIGRMLGCSRQNAGIIVTIAARRLAYRLYRGVPYAASYDAWPSKEAE
jgi:hypothetical protein